MLAAFEFERENSTRSSAVYPVLTLNPKSMLDASCLERRARTIDPGNASPGDGEALKSSGSFCEPDYCGILHSVPAGKAVAAGTVARMSNQACGSVSCAGLLTLVM